MWGKTVHPYSIGFGCCGGGVNSMLDWHAQDHTYGCMCVYNMMLCVLKTMYGTLTRRRCRHQSLQCCTVSAMLYTVSAMLHSLCNATQPLQCCTVSAMLHSLCNAEQSLQCYTQCCFCHSSKVHINFMNGVNHQLLWRVDMLIAVDYWNVYTPAGGER